MSSWWLLPSLESIRLSVQEKKRKRFSKWQPWWSSLISDLNDFSYFDLLVTPMLSTKFQDNWLFGSGEVVKNRFSRWQPCGHLGFPIGTILSIFYLEVIPMLPTKFHVHWPFVSGEEAKNRFSRWWPWRLSWFSDWNNFSFFCSTRHPDASYQSSSQLAFLFRRRSEN